MMGVSFRLSGTFTTIFTLLSLFIFFGELSWASQQSSLTERLALRTLGPAGSCPVYRREDPFEKEFSSAFTLRCTFRHTTREGSINIRYAPLKQSLQTASEFTDSFYEPTSHLVQASGFEPLWGERLQVDDELASRESGKKDQFVSTPVNKNIGGGVSLNGRWEQTSDRGERGYVGAPQIRRVGTFAPDRLGESLTWAWKISNLEPQIRFSRLSDHVELDSSQPRSISFNQQFSLKWNPPRWPSIVIAQERHHQTTTDPFQHRITSVVNTDRTSGTLQYEQKHWGTHLHLFLATTHDQVANAFTRQWIGHSIGAHYQLSENFQVAPLLKVRHQAEKRMELGSTRLSAQVGSTLRIRETLILNPRLQFQTTTDGREVRTPNALSAQLSSKYTPREHSTSFSLLGNFSSTYDSFVRRTFQTIKLTLEVDRLILKYLTLDYYRNVLRILIHHIQPLNVAPASGVLTNTSGMILLSLIP